MNVRMDERPHKEVVEEWLKRIGYVPAFYESHTPVRPAGPAKRLTLRERELVDSVSTERGYRRFQAFGRSLRN